MGRARVLLILAVAGFSPVAAADSACESLLGVVIEKLTVVVKDKDSPDRRASPYFPAYAESRQVYLMLCPAPPLDAEIKRQAAHWDIPLNHL